jgi:hypothetical protein
MPQFKFYDIEEDRAGLVGKENDLVSDDLFTPTQIHSITNAVLMGD